MPHVEESLQLPRDFEGFGEEGGRVSWPNGARIAVSFILNYEEGGERSVEEDGFSEPYLWEKGSTGGVKPGGRYLNSEQDFEYGSRVGCWRVFRLMQEFGWKMTIWAIAKAMEKNPGFARACVRENHEIGAHGLRWLEIWDYNLEEDKKYIKDTWLALKEATGEMPVGFYFGRGSPQTHALVPIALKEIGHKLLYSSEAYNDDVPYWIDLPWEASLPEEQREGMLIVPYNYDCNDGKFHMAPGFMTSAGQTYENYLKSTFDMLYREGGKMMNIPLHARIIGKPGRAEALRNFMQYIKAKPGVWVATRRDIADHYKYQVPYMPGSQTDGKLM
ncbi:carbohydrate esterase family 4 protein [Viridothelium virens]|uniref:Carbohydrate esterase family 4 protein n=1 Tax=Viridothelium virens TaxID=1048519 RepID=A0A6A6HGT9_VIRVR|nr:carbohydrate esterase family 4 protein [Viridothelium virens]